MKKIYILLLSFLTIGLFTGCKEEIDDLQPAPEDKIGIPYFGLNKLSLEFDPTKKVESYKIPIGRTSGKGAATFDILLDEDNDEIFKDFPTEVTFADGETQKEVTLNFPGVENGITYKFKATIVIPDNYPTQSKYLNLDEDYNELSFQFVTLQWDEINGQTMFDCIIEDGTTYTWWNESVGLWGPYYAKYKRATFPDKSIKYRIINAYRSMETVKDANGIADGWPFARAIADASGLDDASYQQMFYLELPTEGAYYTDIDINPAGEARITDHNTGFTMSPFKGGTHYVESFKTLAGFDNTYPDGTYEEEVYSGHYAHIATPTADHIDSVCVVFDPNTIYTNNLGLSASPNFFWFAPAVYKKLHATTTSFTVTATLPSSANRTYDRIGILYGGKVYELTEDNGTYVLEETGFDIGGTYRLLLGTASQDGKSVEWDYSTGEQKAFADAFETHPIGELRDENITVTAWKMPAIFTLTITSWPNYTTQQGQTIPMTHVAVYDPIHDEIYEMKVDKTDNTKYTVTLPEYMLNGYYMYVLAGDAKAGALSWGTMASTPLQLPASYEATDSGVSFN